MPSFRGDSFITYRIPDIKTASLRISITFKYILNSQKSTLLSISEQQQQQQQGVTYLRLLLVESKVVLEYDLGDGPVRLTNNREDIKHNQWCIVDIELKGRYASIRVNRKQAIKNSSTGRLSSFQLNTKAVVSVGGVWRKKPVANNAVGPGFHGCVQQLRLNDKNIDLVSEYEQAHRFSSCYSTLSPCISQPCLNDGVCKTISVGRYHCECPKRYQGQRCERKIKMCGGYLGCKNGGKCWTDLLSGKHMCRCTMGFGGGDCSKSKKYNFLTNAFQVN